jgi:hypothetical protein
MDRALNFDFSDEMKEATSSPLEEELLRKLDGR